MTEFTPGDRVLYVGPYPHSDEGGSDTATVLVGNDAFDQITVNWDDDPESERLEAEHFVHTTWSTKSSGERDNYEGGGVRDAEGEKPRFDLLRPERVPYSEQMLTRWASLMGRGAAHYSDRNWEQMSGEDALARFKSSAARHFEQWFDGEKDEDHAAAIFFNVQGAEYIQGRLDGKW